MSITNITLLNGIEAQITVVQSVIELNGIPIPIQSGGDSFPGGTEAGQVPRWSGSSWLPTLLQNSDISDFDTEVSDNTDVAANSAHRTSTGADHTFIDQDVTTAGTPIFSSVQAPTVRGGATGNDLTLNSNSSNDGSVKIGTMAEFDEALATYALGTTPTSTTRSTIRGLGNTSVTDALIVENSDGTNLLSCRDDGQINALGAIITNSHNIGTTTAWIDFIGNSSALARISNVNLRLGSKPIEFSSGTVTSAGDTNLTRTAAGTLSVDTSTVGDGAGTLIAGNLRLGGSTETATASIKGSGNTSVTYTCKFENSDGTDLLSCRDDGQLYHDGPIASSELEKNADYTINKSDPDTIIFSPTEENQVLTMPVDPEYGDKRIVICPDSALYSFVLAGNGTSILGQVNQIITPNTTVNLRKTENYGWQKDK